MRVVIQQWKGEEPAVCAYRIVAEGVSTVHAGGALGPDTNIHIGWADTCREASERGVAAADALGRCRLVFAAKPDAGKRRKASK